MTRSNHGQTSCSCGANGGVEWPPPLPLPPFPPVPAGELVGNLDAGYDLARLPLFIHVFLLQTLVVESSAHHEFRLALAQILARHLGLRPYAHVVWVRDEVLRQDVALGVHAGLVRVVNAEPRLGLDVHRRAPAVVTHLTRPTRRVPLGRVRLVAPGQLRGAALVLDVSIIAPLVPLATVRGGGLDARGIPGQGADDVHHERIDMSEEGPQLFIPEKERGPARERVRESSPPTRKGAPS